MSIESLANPSDLIAIEGLPLREKQAKIHAYLAWQKQERMATLLREKKELQIQRKKEIHDVKRAMSTGEPKHPAPFKPSVRRKELFTKPGLLPFPSQVKERDALEQTNRKPKPQPQITIVVSRVVSAASEHMKFSKNVRSVKFIDESQRVDTIDKPSDTVGTTVEVHKVHKPSSATIQTISTKHPSRISNSAWLPGSSVPRIFKDDKPLQPSTERESKQRSVSPSPTKDWLPTAVSSRPMSSLVGLSVHAPHVESQNPYVALRNQLVRPQFSERNEPLKFKKLEPFRPGNAVCQVFPQPRVVKAHYPAKVLMKMPSPDDSHI